MSSPNPSARIRVGIVGASPSHGWGTTAHLPALAHLPEFEIAAVATTKRASAEETARAYGVPNAFSDAADLVAYPDVDLVAVTVRVPSHAEIVRAALAAGKHVLCEWPLGVDLEETRQLAGLAASAGVVHAIGLQGLYHPATRFVRDLVADGRIGEIQTATIVAAGRLGGSRYVESLAWAADPANGATILSITGGHLLPVLTEILGPLAEVSAAITSLFDQATVVETGETIPAGSPDQLGMLGTLRNGGLVSMTLHGGGPASFGLEIAGTGAVLKILPVLTAGRLEAQIADWSISLTPKDGPAEQLVVPDRYRDIPADVPPGPPANVAAEYREVARAIAESRQPYSSFQTAVEYHELCAAIETAARTGTRQRVG
jgi:predicted dehydrogenase